mmetsp:Transcript_95536/g.270473  ORF Transcript_95536/g.270473 Transcript_95536/m.270473 type:complete len:246 (-) Transcript_95536:199-936(-)
MAGDTHEAHVRDVVPDDFASAGPWYRCTGIDVADGCVPGSRAIPWVAAGEVQVASAFHLLGGDGELFDDGTARELALGCHMDDRGVTIEELGLDRLPRGQLVALPVPEALQVFLVDPPVAQVDDLAVEPLADPAEDTASAEAALSLAGPAKELPVRWMRHEHPCLRHSPLWHRAVRVLQKLPFGSGAPGTGVVDLYLAEDVDATEVRGRILEAFLPEPHIGILHELHPVALLPADARDVALHHDA